MLYPQLCFLQINIIPLLAHDQAGAYLEESLAGYLSLYREHRKNLLARRGGLKAGHGPVATSWSLAFERLCAKWFEIV